MAFIYILNTYTWKRLKFCLMFIYLLKKDTYKSHRTKKILLINAFFAFKIL